MLLQAHRLYQTHAHSQLFRQTIQLTDGSTARIISVSSKRPWLKLGIDSLSHPSWNPTLRDKMMLSEDGEVGKFKNKFGNMVNDGGLAEFDGLVGTLMKEKKVMGDRKTISGKKK